jgi:hypothetical protein
VIYIVGPGLLVYGYPGPVGLPTPHASLGDPNYDTLKHRLEAAHSALEAAAVEARRRVRLNEGR